MGNINLSNEQTDKILSSIKKTEQSINEIHLQYHAAKLSKIKANFLAMQLKLREQQKAKQQDIKLITNEELFAEIQVGEAVQLEHETEFDSPLHVLPADKLFTNRNSKTNLEKEL